MFKLPCCQDIKFSLKLFNHKKKRILVALGSFLAQLGEDFLSLVIIEFLILFVESVESGGYSP